MVPIGSMITTSVTNTDVNSLTSKAECMAWRGYLRGPAPGAGAQECRNSGQATRGDADRRGDTEPNASSAST